MNITISHSKTKRMVNNAFAICAAKEDLLKIKSAIDSALNNENFSYGWIYVDEKVNPSESDKDSSFDLIARQKVISSTPPSNWD